MDLYIKIVVKAIFLPFDYILMNLDSLRGGVVTMQSIRLGRGQLGGGGTVMRGIELQVVWHSIKVRRTSPTSDRGN